MKIDPIFVSFYTPDYEKEYTRFLTSTSKFNLNVRIVRIPSRGQWIDNVYYRAEFVQDMLELYQRPVVWLDIDAEVMRPPVLLSDFPGDFGAHFFVWPSGKRELLGGTMFFRYCPETLAFVDRWCELNKSMPKQPRSQIVLHHALGSFKGRMHELPAEYTYIERFMPDVKEPVFWHHQASGQHRRHDLEGFNVEDVTSEPKMDFEYK